MSLATTIRSGRWTVICRSIAEAETDLGDLLGRKDCAGVRSARTSLRREFW
jgi:hypothetical protein